MCYFRTTLATK